MKLSDIEFLRLLPSFMREDMAIIGLSKGIDNLVPGLDDSMRLLTTWNHIDELQEAELDDLAVELNVLWYDKSASIYTKRDLIKNCMEVYRHLGTKWAVESVTKSYFGDAYIQEWFEYDGEPGRFRVYSTNPSLSISNDKIDEFMNLLEKVKRASSLLDGIYVSLTGQMPLYAGMAIHEIANEQYSIGSAEIMIPDASLAVLDVARLDSMILG